MKLRVACVVVGFLSLVLSLAAQTSSSSSATSQVPPLIQFSNVATDVNGKPLTGIIGITFYIYQEQQGGAPLWLETQNVQPDKTGHYTVLLGSTTSQGLPTSIFASSEAHWLGMQVSGQEEQPRVLLVSAPYALKAGDADTLGGQPASAFLQTSKQQNGPLAGITGAGKPGYIPVWTTTSNLSNSTIFETKAGKVGIGTTTPTATLDVNGAVTGTSFSGNGSGVTNVNAAALGGFPPGAFAQLTLPNTFTQDLTVNSSDTLNPAIAGNATATGRTSSIGVYGNAVAELGFGVEGTSSGVAGYGVYGANTGGNVGVYGHSSQGYGFATDSHVSQGRSMGGWVKAMVYINDNASGGVAIARCFNSQIAGSSASTVPCGMSLSGISAGYVVDFGFEVDDRLVQVGFTLISEGEYYSLASDGAAISPNQVLVYSATAQGNFFVPFYVFVY
jgi:hypothetical protein